LPTVIILTTDSDELDGCRADSDKASSGLRGPCSRTGNDRCPEHLHNESAIHPSTLRFRV
jgi:hypothetical protein